MLHGALAKVQYAQDPTKQTVTSLEATDQVESVELIFRQRRELELGLFTKLARILGQQPKLRLLLLSFLSLASL